MLLFGMGRLFVRSVLQPTGGVIIGVWMFDGVSVGFNVCPSAYFTSAVTINSRYDFTVFGISSTVVDWLSKITVTSGVSIGSRDSIFGIVLLELAFSVSCYLLLSAIVRLWVSQISSLLNRPHCFFCIFLLDFCCLQVSLIVKTLKVRCQFFCIVLPSDVVTVC